MANRFAWATLHVASLERSLALYRDIIGMKVVDQYRIEPADEDVAVVQQDGGGTIELVAVNKGFDLDITAQENFSLAFEVDDAMDVIKKIGSECRMTVDPAPGTKFYFTNDPDGYPLNLIERK